MSPAISPILLLLFLCVVTTGCRAPKPKNGDKLLAHIPTTVGDKWQIASDYGGGFKDDSIYEVTAVERQDGALVVTTERRSAKGTSPFISRKKVSEVGEFLMEEGEDRYDPPVCVLPMPIKGKDTWKWAKKFVKWTSTAGPDEDVEVS